MHATAFKVQQGLCFRDSDSAQAAGSIFECTAVCDGMAFWLSSPHRCGHASRVQYLFLLPYDRETSSFQTKPLNYALFQKYPLDILLSELRLFADYPRLEKHKFFNIPWMHLALRFLGLFLCIGIKFRLGFFGLRWVLISHAFARRCTRRNCIRLLRQSR